mmetsp:Transcript_19090/g.29018  ORF Transcript_19090/g.29018 Transcript_19090/m.29018 type:complete len:186 (+) Transcript_19090:46-603(+)
MALRSVATHLGIGMACASFWRGAWYVLDDQLYPQDPLKSGVVSLGLGSIGMGASHRILKSNADWKTMSTATSLTTKMGWKRLGCLYIVASSCVLVWRGTWILWDVAYEQWILSTRGEDDVKATDPGHATTSGLVSHVAAAGGLAAFGLFASVFAPPAGASVLRDSQFKAIGRRRIGNAAMKWLRS